MKKENPGSPPKYANSLKIAIAREYLSGDLSSKELSEKYGLGFADAANYFARWYKKRYPNGLEEDKVVAKSPLELSAKERSLSRELEDAHLKIAGLEMMIEIAQKELGIDIRKKSGTKQSPK